MALRDPRVLDWTLTPGQRRVLGELAARLKAHYGDRLSLAAIFGSRARGDARRSPMSTSSSSSGSRPSRRSTRTGSSGTSPGRPKRTEPGEYVPISVIVFSEARFAELKDRELRFARDVEAEGILL